MRLSARERRIVCSVGFHGANCKGATTAIVVPFAFLKHSEQDMRSQELQVMQEFGRIITLNFGDCIPLFLSRTCLHFALFSMIHGQNVAQRSAS